MSHLQLLNPRLNNSESVKTFLQVKIRSVFLSRWRLVQSGFIVKDRRRRRRRRPPVTVAQMLFCSLRARWISTSGCVQIKSSADSWQLWCCVFNVCEVKLSLTCSVYDVRVVFIATSEVKPTVNRRRAAVTPNLSTRSIQKRPWGILHVLSTDRVKLSGYLYPHRAVLTSFIFRFLIWRLQRGNRNNYITHRQI